MSPARRFVGTAGPDIGSDRFSADQGFLRPGGPGRFGLPGSARGVAQGCPVGFACGVNEAVCLVEGLRVGPAERFVRGADRVLGKSLAGEDAARGAGGRHACWWRGGYDETIYSSVCLPYVLGVAQAQGRRGGFYPPGVAEAPADAPARSGSFSFDVAMALSMTTRVRTTRPKWPLAIANRF